MGNAVYSVKLCTELLAQVRSQNLHLPLRRRRYEAGDCLRLPLTLVWPERTAIGVFRIEKFAGGGFAGQVYRCVLENLEVDSELAPACGLRPGGVYAVKILVPPGRFAVWFRNWVYGIAFQAPFSAQVLESACRSGLLWPKVLRLAAGPVFGSPEAVADTYASFYDEEIASYGEVREWVEGRTWRLESDLAPQNRREWRTVDPLATNSPEYVSKRQFMARLVAMLHEMGADELARQYAWSTCKSQPNVLKRYGNDDQPASGLCAVDFRAGLALVPFLPMSPGDFRLILKGLLRGSIAQFDRFDPEKLRAYTDSRPEVFAGREAMVEALIRYDQTYRRRMPDVTHQGVRLLTDAGLRADVREGLVAGYRCARLVDDVMAERLRRGGWRFVVFYLLGIVPLAGRFVRSLWGCPAYRQHWKSLLTQPDYLRRSGWAAAATAALEWHRAGRIGETHAQRIAAHPGLFWLERLTVGWMPAFLHRWITEPVTVWGRLRASMVYVRRFLGNSLFREQWLRDQIEEGRREGMLGETEAGEMLQQVSDPFIAKYLKSVGVHLAFLPVTQVVSLTVGAVLALKTYALTHDLYDAGKTFALVLAFFQVFPISPGSICRGLYVVYLMIHERNFRDYVVAAPLSFVKYVGYLAFPIQMATAYPALSRFMAGRWATSAVHIVPVFGEKGALLEHAVFDLFFNRSRLFGRLLSRHLKLMLTVWMLLGLSLGVGLYFRGGLGWQHPETLKRTVNVFMTIIVIFLLPRLLFFPLLSRRGVDAGQRTK